MRFATFLFATFFAVAAFAADEIPNAEIVYKKVGDRELRLFVFQPTEARTGNERRPAVLVIHGGGWQRGSAQNTHKIADYFSRHGLVGVSLEYRLQDTKAGVAVSDCVSDARSAMRYLRAHADDLGIDPEKLVACGVSAGGHLAAGTALFDGFDEASDDPAVSPRPAALILFAPVLDTSASGYGNKTLGESWQSLSPLLRVRPKLPPALLFHSKPDTTVPYQGSVDFVSAMKQAGNRCELVTYEDGKHGFMTHDAALLERALDRAMEFLKKENIVEALTADGGPRLPMIDLSADTARQVIVAQGTPTIYQGHPTTVLLPDGKTMFCVWSIDHGGPCGPLKRSDDGGRTWSELLPVPESWKTVENCPAIYRLTDPQGVARLIVFAGQGPDGSMHQSVSEDEGRTWSPMKSNGLVAIMPFCTILAIDGGKTLLGMSNLRRSTKHEDRRSNVIAQSLSHDGGLTWSPWKVVLDLPPLGPCEPALVRSPDGKQLLCLVRENTRRESLFMTSDDEGRTWSAARKTPVGLYGDRHVARYAPDGRLVVTFRDTGKGSPTRNHFMAWVGRYDDIIAGHDGEFRVKLLHSHDGRDCGYPGLELLPDGTFVATTYIKYRPTAEKQSVVSTRFNLADLSVSP